MNPRFLDYEDVFIIAEIGGNHEGNLEYAKRLLHLAAQSGAHAVKFQTYKADKIVSMVEGPERHKHFRMFELPDEEFMELAKLVKEDGALFMSSLWDMDAVEKFNPYVKIHKIGSGDLTNYPILEAIARKNQPVILSTAMATIEEVKETVAFINKINPQLVKERKLALLHCVAMYGDPKDEYANLLGMKKLQDEFPDLPVGYSDHTVGTYACELAVAMGASILEIHFTDDKTRKFRDHQISVTKDELIELTKKIKQIKKILGSYEKVPVGEIETPQRIAEFRRSVYLNKDLPAGTVLTRAMLTTLRPNKGIDARRFYDMLGKKLRTDKRAFEAIQEEEIEWS